MPALRHINQFNLFQKEEKLRLSGTEYQNSSEHDAKPLPLRGRSFGHILKTSYCLNVNNTSGIDQELLLTGYNL